MAMTDDHPHSTWLRDVTAVAIGLTVPVMVSGRAILQGIVAAALIAVLIVAWRDRAIFARAGAAVRSRFGMIVLAAFAGMAISIPGSLDPLRSFEAWARTLAYIGGCTLFWAFLSGDPRALRQTTRTLVLFSLISVGIIIIAQLGYREPLKWIRGEFRFMPSTWAFHAPKAYAALGACAAPVLAWVAVRETGAWRWAALSAALLLVYIVITTANKSALGGLLTMLLVVSFALATRKNRKWLAAWVVWAVATTAAVLLLVYELPDEPSSTAVWDWVPPQLVDTHRQQIWHFTAGKIAEAPWTGYGINVINRVEGAGDILPGYEAEALPSHPHNWILEILGETGLIGFIPVFFAIAWSAARSFRRYLLWADPAALAQLGLTAVFWGSSLFNFSIWSSWWLIGYFLLMAVISAGTRQRT
ncbi:O-antigen ligase family protein [bacterium SCSIO 12827]|nr:O-antigen ligase family protein [bacterium SCSIO 12827]